MPVEEPDFVVSRTDGAIQLRDYPPLVVAEVSVVGNRDAAANEGFRLLAGYIFGGNVRRERIAMTAPVVQKETAVGAITITKPVLRSGAPAAWTVRFMMPKGASLESLPTPNDQRVRLVVVPNMRYAIIRFSGLALGKDIEGKADMLSAFLKSSGLQADGEISLARYNSPWTPWFMRRNEVWIPLQVEAAARGMETVP